MTKFGIEDREHASLEILSARHRQRYDWSCIVTHRRNYVEEMFGVVAGSRTAREREIIARALAFVAELFRRRPHERVEPVDGTCKTTECMAHEIAPLHVRELVKKHGPAAIESPALAVRGENDGRRDESAREWHFRIAASEEARRILELETIGDFPERRHPVLCVERVRVANNAAHCERTICKPPGEEQDDDSPDSQQERSGGKVG
jgi:hypothetical protein